MSFIFFPEYIIFYTVPFQVVVLEEIRETYNKWRTAEKKTSLIPVLSLTALSAECLYLIYAYFEGGI